MISQKELLNAYNNLYSSARAYIWNFYQVETIAELETATYKACPNVVEIRSALTRFQLACKETLRTDEEFQKAFDNFQKLIYEDDIIYTPINKVQEVLDQGVQI